MFIGLMENYGRVEELQRKAENSSGALMEASEKKANSLEGQLNKLQNAWYRLYEAMLGSGVAKGGVQAIFGAMADPLKQKINDSTPSHRNGLGWKPILSVTRVEVSG